MALPVVVAVSIMLVMSHPVTSATVASSPLLGKTAPQLRGYELDGGSFNLTDHRGQIVIVNFWASWCVACVKEAPELSTFAWRERQRGVVLIGVVYNDSVSSARAFEDHYGSLYRSIVDPGGVIANSYGVTAPPTTFVIDRHGRIVVTLLGPVDSNQLVSVIARVRS
ncbi:MAG: TlpA family protein disulfide reductase [Hyphomicrobiales bacterium]